MPAYELSLILKIMQRPEAKATLKRAGEAILTRNGIIRKIENLGTKFLPFPIRAHDNNHEEGSYFLIHFESSPKILSDLTDHCKRDIDIIKPHIISKETFNYHPPKSCSLEEELLPPALRPSVKELLKQSKRRRSAYKIN